MNEKAIVSIVALCTLVAMPVLPSLGEVPAGEGNVDGQPSVRLDVEPHAVVYEGDIVDCEVTGDPAELSWQIDDGGRHGTFAGDDPVLYDPEPTPLSASYVNLTVYAANSHGSDMDTVPVRLKQLFFGDIHWHTRSSDGDYRIDEMYGNAVADNYLDFAACTDHAELIDGFNVKFGGVPRSDWLRTIMYKLLLHGEWKLIQSAAREHYNTGVFSTLLGFEWTAAEWSLGGRRWSRDGCQDVGHVNFYYRDIYPGAPEYADWQRPTYDGIFQAMAREHERGHRVIGFPHHPQGKTPSDLSFATNFTYLADGVQHETARDQVLRGAEVYSRWGSAVGQHYTPGVPWRFPYPEEQFINQTDAWIENACWEWSQHDGRQPFAFIAGSDTHDYPRPGSAETNLSHLGAPSGLAAVYAVHNTRGEIWDALNNGSCYASQLLKIRANARFDGQLAYGRRINCTAPLDIRVTARSTFQGNDSSGKTMCPHGFTPEELDRPITDIWVVKKNRERGRPWCRVVEHVTPDSDVCTVTVEDPDVQDNDFYWVAVRQGGTDGGYMAYLGPVFIDQAR